MASERDDDHAIVCNKETVASRIFVGNIDLSLTRDKVAEHFSQFGKVVGCAFLLTKNDKSFGCVQFESNEVAEACVKTGTTAVIEGKSVDIKPARVLGTGLGGGGKVDGIKTEKTKAPASSKDADPVSASEVEEVEVKKSSSPPLVLDLVDTEIEIKEIKKEKDDVKSNRRSDKVERKDGDGDVKSNRRREKVERKSTRSRSPSRRRSPSRKRSPSVKRRRLSPPNSRQAPIRRINTKFDNYKEWFVLCRRHVISRCIDIDCEFVHISKDDAEYYRKKRIVPFSVITHILEKKKPYQTAPEGIYPACEGFLDKKCVRKPCPLRHLSRADYEAEVQQLLKAQFRLIFDKVDWKSSVSFDDQVSRITDELSTSKPSSKSASITHSRSSSKNDEKPLIDKKAQMKEALEDLNVSLKDVENVKREIFGLKNEINIPAMSQAEENLILANNCFITDNKNLSKMVDTLQIENGEVKLKLETSANKFGFSHTSELKNNVNRYEVENATLTSTISMTEKRLTNFCEKHGFGNLYSEIMSNNHLADGLRRANATLKKKNDEIICLIREKAKANVSAAF